MRLFFKLLPLLLLCTGLTHVSGEEKETSDQAKPIVLQSSEFTLIVPQSRDRILAFSLETGDWSKTKIAGKPSADVLAKLQPTVSGEMAICPVGRDLYAYSAESGNWSRLRVPEQAKFTYSVGEHFVRAQIETEAGATQYFLFGENSIVWSGVDLATGKLLSANAKTE